MSGSEAWRRDLGVVLGTVKSVSGAGTVDDDGRNGER